MDALGTWGAQPGYGSRSDETVRLGRWAALSIGLHGLILGGIVCLHVPAPAPRESSLRVKLLTEVREAPPPLPAPPAPRTRPRASPSIAPPARETVAASPEVKAWLAEPEPSVKAQAPSPDGAAPAPIVTNPPTGNAIAQPPPRAGPPGEGRSDAGPLRPTASLSNPEMAPMPAAPKPAATAQGIVLLPGGSEGGLGRAGIGAADRGTGFAGGGADREGQAGRRNEGPGSGNSGGTGGGFGVASQGGGGGAGGSDGVADLLRSIRRRIEQAKIYPDAARRAGMEGTVELRFQIGQDGNAEGLEIVRSSGHAELDEMAMQTIRRAGPYPPVSGRIRIPLSYRLDR